MPRLPLEHTADLSFTNYRSSLTLPARCPELSTIASSALCSTSTSCARSQSRTLAGWTRSWSSTTFSIAPLPSNSSRVANLTTAGKRRTETWPSASSTSLPSSSPRSIFWLWTSSQWMSCCQPCVTCSRLCRRTQTSLLTTRACRQ